MPQEIADPPSDLQARAEKVLTDFLSRDLDLAFTFLQTPEVETGIDRARHSAAIQKARLAVETVQRFGGRVGNPQTRGQLRDRAAQLQAALNAFQSSDSPAD